MEFAKWCVATEESVQTHKLRGLGIATGGQAHAIGAIAKAVPGYYTDPKRVADLLRKLGKPAAAAHQYVGGRVGSAGKHQRGHSV